MKQNSIIFSHFFYLLNVLTSHLFAFCYIIISIIVQHVCLLVYVQHTQQGKMKVELNKRSGKLMKHKHKGKRMMHNNWYIKRK